MRRLCFRMGKMTSASILRSWRLVDLTWLAPTGNLMLTSASADSSGNVAEISGLEVDGTSTDGFSSGVRPILEIVDSAVARSG